MGVRLKHLNDTSCTVALPLSWRSQNPFRSLYFAAQCAAAALSTGLPAWQAVRRQTEPISMLVTHVEASFLKKADRTLHFTCREVQDIEQAVQRAAAGAEAQVVRILSVGTLPDGTEAAHVWITWSFKRKTKPFR